MASSQPEAEAEPRKHVEDLLDEALEESFPASDVPAVSFPEPRTAETP